MAITKKTSLSGHVLVAMPDMQDDRFSKALVYLFDHSDQGAMGLILNKHLGELKLTDLIDNKETAKEKTAVSVENDTIDVFFGGPVETERGFVIHSTDVTFESSLFIQADIAVTSTLDILKAIAAQKGPSKRIFALGYAGWSPGQLEEEIKQNAWLTLKPSAHIVFDAPQDTDKAWTNAYEALGLNPGRLTGGFGTA